MTNKKIKQKIIDGYDGKEYYTEAEEFEGYDLIEEPKNKIGKMTRDTIEINYYYLYKSKITINHIEKDTNRILSQEIKEGHEGDIIETKENIPEYYKLYKKPEIEEYTLGKNPMRVQYEYMPLEFNIKLTQTIEKIIINNQEKQINNSIYKFEISKEQPENNIQIYYKIKVSNNSEIIGNTEIFDYIPSGYIALPEENPEWDIKNNIAIRMIENLQIGETREYAIILKNIQKNSVQTIENNVIAKNSTNKAKFSETTLEDNSQTTKCIISISTGIEKVNQKYIYIFLFISINIALILLILRHKKK